MKNHSLRILAVSLVGILWGIISTNTSAQAAANTSLIDDDSTFDVTYVSFDLAVRPDTEYISGSVLLRSVAQQLSSDSTIVLSLRQQLMVDSIWSDGLPTTFQHVDDRLFVRLRTHYSAGQVFDVRVFYHGFSTEPDRRGFIHTWQDWLPTGIPISWSASEPWGAKVWWPCKDNPADKIDSADLRFTCDTPYSIASNGLLRAVTQSGARRTFWWHESYPIDFYLLAFACTEYDTLVHTYTRGAESFPIVDYVFPGSADTMRASLALLDTLLDYYQRWFGPYAFAREKYGMAQWHGGGMENETISFVNDGTPDLLAHETAHQWFGDAVTCKRWNECWLNESFATYVTDLFDQAYHGDSLFAQMIRDQEKDVTSQPGGSVFIPDSILHDHVLDGRLVYNKGGLVLNMLRFVLGDSAFIRGIRSYITGPLRYGVATTDDFRQAMEKSSEIDLKWFFDQWIFSEGYPTYDVQWTRADSTRPIVTIRQRGSTSDAPLFKMPVELEFLGPGVDSTVRVTDSLDQQNFSFTFQTPIYKVIFDPHNWLLDGAGPQTLDVRETAAGSASQLSISEGEGELIASYRLSHPAWVLLEVVDVVGRVVAKIGDGFQGAGQHDVTLSTPRAGGNYFVRLLENGRTTAIGRFVR